MPHRNRLTAGARPQARRLFDRFWDIAGAVSVRTKILGIVLTLVLLLGLGVTLQVHGAMQRALVAELVERSTSTARDLAARATDLILVNDLYALHQLLAETQANNPDVRYAFILDARGQVIAHTFGAGFPLDLTAANPVAAEDHHRTVVLETDEGPVWDTAVPIFEGRAGTARVGMTEQRVNATMDALTGQILITILFVSAVGIVAASLLTWVVTRPILRLKQASSAVGQGDFSQWVKPWAGDEIGKLAEAFNTMTADLARAAAERAEREQLRARYVKGVIAAQEDERKRIARELHDETGQALTSLMVRLRSLMEQCPLPELKPQLEQLRALIAQTLDGVHDLALELRPSVLDDLGLAAAIDRYVGDWRQRHALEVDLAMVGLEDERLPPVLETALYRIVQESLTNVARHARARTVSVLVELRDGRVRLVIEDDGAGFDPGRVGASARPLGLYGMQERTELLGGTFVVESTPGRGTSLFVEVPVVPLNGREPSAPPA